MKFKQYIKEEKVPKTLSEINSFIESNCQPYLRERGFYNPLYRGMRGITDETFIRKPREDRKPKDMALAVSQALDIVLKEKIGWKPRSEGIFTTTNKSEASVYGNPYVIFPIGSFKYVWFTPNIADTILIATKILSYMFDKKMLSMSGKTQLVKILRNDIKTLSNENYDLLMEATRNILNQKNEPVTKGLKHLNKTIEVTLKCKKYLAVRPDIYNNLYVRGNI